MKTDAVFFISFGGPDKSEDIRPFLEIVTRGRRIPPERIEEVVHHYEAIGGKSPINEITFHQAEAVSDRLERTETPWPVYVGNRNWHPFIVDTLRKMTSDGIQRAIGFPTAAHRTEASWQRYVNAVEEARQNVPDAPKITYVGPWFDHPLFIDAIVDRIRQANAPAGASWIFTAHSIPVSMAEQSRYVEELNRTAELAAAKWGMMQWKLAYTSRSGDPAEPWLEPDISDEIRELANTGVRDILAIPIGFVADHVEILFDLDVEAKRTAQQAGILLHRAETVGVHPSFINMIVDVVRKTAASIPA